MKVVVAIPLHNQGMQIGPDGHPTNSALGGALNLLMSEMADLARDINSMQAKLDKISKDLDQMKPSHASVATAFSRHPVGVVPR